MDRQEKIDVIIEVFEENNIKIIETQNLGAIIVEADMSLDKEQDKFEYKELLEKGLTEKQIEEFKKFLDDNFLMMIRNDNVQGVSFENLECGLDDSDLWETEEKEEENSL